MFAYMTRGLPGCGKSTFAKKFLDANLGFIRRINLDGLRVYVLAKHDLALTWPNAFRKDIEAEVTKYYLEILATAAKFRDDIILDNCHISEKTFQKEKDRVEKLGYTVVVCDFRGVPLQTCLDRNRQRKGFENISEKVIIDFWNNHIAKSEEERVYMPEKIRQKLPNWMPTENLPNCVIFDIDGTLAELGDRGRFDEKAVFVDTVRNHVLFTLKAFIPVVDKIFIFSGRQLSCREETVRWLAEKCGLGLELKTGQVELFMRPSKDQRGDEIIKTEIFNENVLNRFNVIGVFDDRRRVILNCWKPLGVPVFRCGLIEEDDF